MPKSELPLSRNGLVKPIHVHPLRHEESDVVWHNPKLFSKKIDAFELLYSYINQTSLDNKGSRLAYMTPRGGRTLSYEAPQALQRIGMHEVDTKGSGLTPVGYAIYRQGLAGQYAEFMHNPEREELFGALGYQEAEADALNCLAMQKKGMRTPTPLAIIEPQRWMLGGREVSASHLPTLSNVDRSNFPVIYVRGWPNTSLRLADFIAFPSEISEDGYSLPDNRAMDALNPILERDLIEAIKQARISFARFGLPLLCRSGMQVYEHFSAQMLSSLATMADNELSPTFSSSTTTLDGLPIIDAGQIHTHNQNMTPDGLWVEWGYLMNARSYEPHTKHTWFRELTNQVFEKVITMAMLALPDLRDLPDFDNFKLKLLVSHPEIANRFGVQTPSSIFRILSQFENFKNFLQDQNKRLVIDTRK